MKATPFGLAPARETGSTEHADATRCTRCGQPWNYAIVEQVEVWTCRRCGYEVRERSADHDAMVEARHESMMS